MLTQNAANPGSDHRPLALLADSDADTRRVYGDFLRRTFEVDDAEDGRVALAKALTRHPDVVVTETHLPGIDGCDLCQLLRSDAITRDIAVVLVARDRDDVDIMRAETSGADAVLVKPYLPDQLAVELRRVLAHSHELRARARAIRERLAGELARSAALLAGSPGHVRRATLSHSHDRHHTSTPPLQPPSLVCPNCDEMLSYIKSHVGGVSERHSEQWDYFECQNGCGTFQYRQRTRHIRRVS